MTAIPLIGTWVLGDKLKDLVYTVNKQDLSGPYDLTGCTVSLVMFSRDTRAKRVTAGVVGAPATTGIVTFSDLTNGYAMADGRSTDTFEARIEVIAAGPKPGWVDDVFAIAFTRPPGG